MNEQTTTKAWGIASLASSVVGILLVLMPYFGLPLSIMAIIFAGKQNKVGNTGIATAGKITGIVGIVLNAIMLVLVGFTLLIMLATGM